MKTIKSIEGKSLLIGGLLASTIFFAMGATSKTDKWDDKQEWITGRVFVDYDYKDKVYTYSLSYVAWGLDKDVLGSLQSFNVRTSRWPAGWEPIGLSISKDTDGDRHYYPVRKRIK